MIAQAGWSFAIFGRHWLRLLRASVGAICVAGICLGIAFLGIGVTPRPYVGVYWAIAVVIAWLISGPLEFSAVPLAVALVRTGDAPVPATFESSVGLWPSQLQVMVAFAVPAVVTGVLGQWVWNSMVVEQSRFPAFETAGLAIAAVCFICTAVLIFLNVIAAVQVALYDASPRIAAVAAFDRLFLGSVTGGVAAAVLYYVLAGVLPYLIIQAISFGARALHAPLLLVLNAIVGLACFTIGITFAVLYAGKERGMQSSRSPG